MTAAHSMTVVFQSPITIRVYNYGKSSEPLLEKRCLVCLFACFCFVLFCVVLLLYLFLFVSFFFGGILYFVCFIFFRFLKTKTNLSIL